ncbi:uncharacterized protein TNCV_619751 [Trichonephila clavipes]|nr:uncharacterized protein TNCV_619751 [Trichonephila clavipes]
MEWNDIEFSDESCFCLQYHDVQIQVWRPLGERLLNYCFTHRHTIPAPCIMVWGGFGFHCRTCPSTYCWYTEQVLEPYIQH